MNKQKQLSINLIAGSTAFIINLGISFFLSPYIIKNIGIEAYGFVSLGTNFISYASLITIALNSMAGRFITIEIHKNNWDAANKYFNSVLLSNAIVAGVMMIPSILCVLYIDKIVNVPPEILTDVKALFAFLFANYLLSVMVSSFGVATFATNRLYLSSLRGIQSGIIRVAILVLLFIFFKPRVSYIGFTSLISLLYGAFFNMYYTKKLLPNIQIRKAYFNSKAVLELISSGIWNTVIRVGQILLEGMDLLIANLFIGAAGMGALSLAKTIPAVISSLVVVLASVFMPEFTRMYAHDKINDLKVTIKRSMKLLGLIINIPIAILVVFGKELFALWVPSQDSRQLQILSLITVGTIVLSGTINSIYGVFTVTNRLKTNAILLVLTGVLNIGIVFVLLKVTNLGIYAIAGVSTVLSIGRNLGFTAPFGAKYLGLPWYTFFPEIFKSIMSFVVATVIGFSITYFRVVDSWVALFIFGGLTGLLSLAINIMVILNKQERNYLINIIKQRLRFG